MVGMAPGHCPVGPRDTLAGRCHSCPPMSASTGARSTVLQAASAALQLSTCTHAHMQQSTHTQVRTHTRARKHTTCAHTSAQARTHTHTHMHIQARMSPAHVGGCPCMCMCRLRWALQHCPERAALAHQQLGRCHLIEHHTPNAEVSLSQVGAQSHTHTHMSLFAQRCALSGAC